MGYDVSFQLIDPRRVQDELLPRLLDGGPPPAPFDARPDAAASWSRARAAVLGGEPPIAARAACELVLAWSARTLPHATTRNLAVTHHPLRMEDELQGIPNAGFGSAEPLFGPLVARRPELRGHFPSRLGDDSSPGGLCRDPDFAGREMRRFRLGLPDQLRRRVSPVLSALRAAERRRLFVWENALDLELAAPELLRWPGLTRWGADDGPLSAAEWTRLADVGLTCVGDVLDLMDVAVTLDPAADTAAVREVLRLLRRIDPGHLADHGGPVVRWLHTAGRHPDLHLGAWLAEQLVERGFDGGDVSLAGVTPAAPGAAAALARSILEEPPTGTTPLALDWVVRRAAAEHAGSPEVERIVEVVLPGAARALATAPPSGRLGGPVASRGQWTSLCFALRDAACSDGAVPPALRPLFARAWKVILEVDPDLAGNFAERIGGALGECLAVLFEDRPAPSREQMTAVSALFHAADGPLREAERAAITAAHGDALVALVHFGLAHDRRAVSRLLRRLDVEPRLAPMFEGALRSGDLALAEDLVFHVPSAAARACVEALLAGGGAPARAQLDAVNIACLGLDGGDREAVGRAHREHLRALLALGEAQGADVSGLREVLGE